MQSNIKNLIKSIIFLFILGVLVMKTGVFLRPVSKDADVFVDYYDLEENSIDVALIGSSALYRFWIPPQVYEEQGMTSSMLYCSGQDVSTIPYVIDEIMKTQDPDVILVESRRIISERVNQIDGMLNEEKIDYYTQLMLSGMKPSVTKYKIADDVLELNWDEKLEYMIPLLKYHDNIFEYSTETLVNRANEDLIDNTLKLQSKSIEKQDFKLYSESEYTDEKFTDEDLAILDEIHAKAEEYGKRVIFLSMPYASSLRGQTLQAEMCDYMDEKGYEYINLTIVPDKIGLNFETDFYNGSHTNISGAEKITSYLSEHLMENYEIDTNHSASTKSFWHQFVSAWNIFEKKQMEKWREECETAQ